MPCDLSQQVCECVLLLKMVWMKLLSLFVHCGVGLSCIKMHFIRSLFSSNDCLLGIADFNLANHLTEQVLQFM